MRNYYIVDKKNIEIEDSELHIIILNKYYNNQEFFFR